MNKQEPHARPLKHGFGDDRKRNQTTELQARNRHHRHEGIAQRMPKVNRAVAQAAGPREADVVSPEHLEHLRAHKAHDERELKNRQGCGG